MVWFGSVRHSLSGQCIYLERSIPFWWWKRCTDPSRTLLLQWKRAHSVKEGQRPLRNRIKERVPCSLWTVQFLVLPPDLCAPLNPRMWKLRLRSLPPASPQSSDPASTGGPSWRWWQWSCSTPQIHTSTCIQHTSQFLSSVLLLPLWRS